MAEIYDKNPEFASRTRQKIFSVLLLITALVFTGRLAFLQLIEGNVFRLKSEAQAIKENIIEPFRGNIFDRSGKLLVHNEPSFTVTLTPNEFKRESLPLLYSILELDTSEVEYILNSRQRSVIFSPIKIYRDLSYDKLAELEEYSDLLPGVDVIIESKRLYAFDDSVNMAHTLGYTREINRRQLDKMKYYNPGDIIGQAGLEDSYNNELFGAKGVKFVAVNRRGKKIASFDNGKSDIPAKNGFNLYLSIDYRLQAAAESLLEGKKGAVIAMNPNNGEILAIASNPDFNLRHFTGKIPPSLFENLYSNKNAPMLNRAIQSPYPPGSTIKMLFALAGMQEGEVQPNSHIYSKGYFQIGRRTAGCHAPPGSYNVEKSIRMSCNVYYYKLSLELGHENIIKYSKMFGFGEKTGIDIPGEKTGIIPTKEWLKKHRGIENPTKGMIINYGIGQGEYTATPLQIAAYTAAIANEGIYYQPHIVKEIFNNITYKKEKLDYRSEKLPIEKRYFKAVKKGMYGVVNLPGGTARNVWMPDVEICGKTGTAQDPPRRPHSWFTSFAPYKDPEIVVTVFIENGGYGTESAAPIAKSMYEAYFYPEGKEEAPADTLAPSDSLGGDITYEGSRF